MSNSTCKIANTTSKKDLVVINASVDSDSPRAFYYDQKTVLLPFNSVKVLKPGNSDTFTIPAINKDSSGYSLPFTFIVAEAETLAPVKSVTCKADLSDLGELIIDESTVSDIAQVFDFHKNIAAVPGSELAIDFAALDLADDKAVGDFFNRQDDYRKVTLDALHLVQSYYNALPYGWANGKNTVIYLYRKKDDDGTDDGAMKSIGTVHITNNWSQPLPLTPADPFKLELKLDGEAVRTLYFSNGVFRDNQDATKATVSLTGSFFIPSLMLDDQGNNKMATYLVGSINGASVFGYEGAKPDGIDDGSFWKLLSVHNVRDGVTLGAYCVGIIAAIVLLVKVAQFIKWCKERGNPAVDAKKRAAQAEKLEGDLIVEVRNDLRQVNEEIIVPPPENIQAAQNNYSAEQLVAKTDQAKNSIRRMADAQFEALNVIANKYVNKDMEIAFDNLGRVRQLADDGVVDNYEEWVPESLGLLNHNVDTIVAARVFIASKLSVEDIRSYKESMKAVEDMRIVVENNQREVRDIKSKADEREIIEEE